MNSGWVAWAFRKRIKVIPGVYINLRRSCLEAGRQLLVLGCLKGDAFFEASKKTLDSVFASEVSPDDQALAADQVEVIVNWGEIVHDLQPQAGRIAKGDFILRASFPALFLVALHSCFR